MDRWKPAIDATIAIVCMVWLWVILLLATMGAAGLMVHLLTHFDQSLH